MGLIHLTYEEGQTPLDEDEKEGLLIPSVTTKGELDEVEQLNIEKAVRWTIMRRKRFTIDEVLTEPFINALHNRMFGEVWDWAGRFRNTNKNIGVDKYQISIELRHLLDDCRYWLTNQTFAPDEIAIRFKHRLVSIHCFANGNGRHSRLMGDLLIDQILTGKVFSWGGQNFTKTGDQRNTYLTAIRAADAGNYELLLSFARS